MVSWIAISISALPALFVGGLAYTQPDLFGSRLQRLLASSPAALTASALAVCFSGALALRLAFARPSPFSPEQRQGKRPLRLLGHPRFRAGYDFLLLRCASGEAPEELGQWWTEFQALNPDEQNKTLGPERSGKKRRRRRPRRRPAGESQP